MRVLFSPPSSHRTPPPERGLARLARLLALAFWALSARAAESPDFTDAPIYELGEIPFQTVWEGRETKFRVRATALGPGTPVTAGYAQPPSGTVFFEAGNFLYRPGPNDKAEFSVTFSAAVGPNRLEQIVPIQPIPLLPPESDLLGVERKGVPDPTSRDYLAISDLKETGETQFNHARRRLRTVTVSGKEIVLREGHANRLFETFNANPDLREFRIHAETLIVASPFRLPGTRIVLRARRIEFQDFGDVASHLSTQPLDYPTTPTQASIAGASGLPAGDLEIYAETVSVPPANGMPPPRFMTKGGAGQNGAPGLDGTPGPIFKRTDPDHFTTNNPDQAPNYEPPIARRNATTGFALDSDRDGKFDVYTSVPATNAAAEIRRANDIARTTVVSRWVTGSEWRPDGEDATPGGAPGNGGPAGKLISNLPVVLDFADTSGGVPGSTPAYRGGAAGSPSPAYFYLAQDVGFGSVEIRRFELLATHTAKTGKDAAGKTGTAGSDGGRSAHLDSLSWLDPRALRQVVNHAADAYLEGELEFVQRLATDYLALIARRKASPEWTALSADDRRDFGLLEEELGLFAHRTASGLDYFGNPAGWVPLLSLEASASAFQGEIERAIGILYLQYWLTNAATALQGKIGALADARRTLALESEKLAADFDTANTLLPNLENQVMQLQTETVAVQNALKFLEADLLSRAKDNLQVPFWKRLARGLASVAKLIPIPAVQAIGAGLNLVANFNPDQPWDSLEGVVDIVGQFQDGDFAEKAKALNASYKKIKFPELPDSADPDTVKDYVDDLQKASKPIVDKLDGVRRAFQGTQAPRSQIEAELARLKAESKEFKQLGDRVSALMAEKAAFAEQVSHTLQLLGNLSGNITANLLAMDALNEDYALAAGALDDRALMYLNEIGRRARHRLLLFHYYVKKAYEYRLLRPYPGRLNLVPLLDRFSALAEQSAGTYQRLNGEQFRELRGIFDDALGELVREVITEYNRNAPALAAPRRLSLAADELARLNAGEEVPLNLRTLDGTGLFPKAEENLRIANVRILRVAVESSAPARDGDEISLYVTHGGASEIQTSAGNRPRAYRFQHYSGETEVPIQWGARYFPKGNDLVPISRSLSASSLLGALLQRTGTSPRDAGYFTYPGALAQFHLKRELTTAPGTTLRLQEVVLEIEYEFVRRAATVRSLEITTTDGLAPYVEVSVPDLAGRQDGLGTFERVYPAQTEITLSAPDRIGNLRFAGFVEVAHGGNPNPVLHHAAAPEARTAATPRPATSEFDGTRHRLKVNLSTDRRLEARYTTLGNLRVDIQERPSGGVVKLSLDGERYTPYRLETTSHVGAPWIPVREGTLVAPEEFTLPVSGENAQFFRATPR